MSSSSSDKANLKSAPDLNEKTESLPKIFMRKLREAEESREVKALSALFTNEAQLENLTRPSLHRHGVASTQTQSAENFWRQYLAAFESIESHFTNVIDDGQTAVLEWHSTGRLSMGTGVDYAGVSILEYSGDQIEKFRTYYDSAALLPHASKSDRHYSESVGQPEISTEASS